MSITTVPLPEKLNPGDVLLGPSSGSDPNKRVLWAVVKIKKTKSPKAIMLNSGKAWTTEVEADIAKMQESKVDWDLVVIE